MALTWRQRFHYRKASSGKRCATCGAYVRGICQMFDARVQPRYLCDRWYAKRKARAK